MRGFHLRATLWFLTAGALFAFGSCSDSSPAPTPIPRPNPGITTPVVVNLEIGAPESVALGTTAQLTLRVIRNDGSSENVTSDVQWSTSNPNVLPVDSQGVITARQPGEARITARYQSRTASNTVLSLPPGTFRLRGRITDEGTALGGVTVEVIAGTGQGLTARSDSGGAYALYGVAGSIKLHSKRTDYQNLIQDVQVSGDATHDMAMTVATPRDPLGGQYRVTFTAVGCSNIPSELIQRAYDATVEHRGSQLTVSLTGADFLVFNGRGNQFRGSYNPDGRIVFSLGDAGFYYYYYYFFNPIPDLVERVSGTSALIINGSSISHHDGNGIIAGTFSGTFNVTNRLTSPYWPYSASCQNNNHRFELRRR